MTDKITVLEFQMIDGTRPYRQWFDGLLDQRTRLVIDSRLGHVRHGTFGNFRTVGNGVFELKIYFGPGYRIYYVHDDAATVILLFGGDKDSQDRDIRRAKEYASDYWRRK